MSRTLTFVDGNLNRFTMTTTTLTYRPITPEESSSGMYSGGAPWVRELTDSQRAELVELFETAEREGVDIERHLGLTKGTCRISGADGSQKAVQSPERLLAALRALKP
jgi:hypothetical protein